MLYAYAAARGVAHRICGKLVVATTAEEIAALHALKANAEANGVVGIALLTPAEARGIEPASGLHRGARRAGDAASSISTN